MSKTKLIRSKKSWRSSRNLALSIILICLSFSGCARAPWTTPLDENQTENTVQFLQRINQKSSLCSDSIDGDISLSYQNIFDKKNVSGYFQLLSPTFIKLIVLNPLGQPVLAVTSDQHTFQLINTFKRKYIAGKIFSYGMIHNIPPALLTGNWQNWIRGKISIDIDSITTVRNDRENRGIWVTTTTETNGGLQKTHLLIEQSASVLRSQIIESDKGELIAEITYDNWVRTGNCQQPRTIKVTGLEYDTELTIQLSNVQPANLKKDDFRLKYPAGYLKQITP